MVSWFLSLDLISQLILAFFGGMTLDAVILVFILYSKKYKKVVLILLIQSERHF